MLHDEGSLSCLFVHHNFAVIIIYHHGCNPIEDTFPEHQKTFPTSAITSLLFFYDFGFARNVYLVYEQQRQGNIQYSNTSALIVMILRYPLTIVTCEHNRQLLELVFFQRRRVARQGTYFMVPVSCEITPNGHEHINWKLNVKHCTLLQPFVCRTSQKFRTL